MQNAKCKMQNDGEPLSIFNFQFSILNECNPNSEIASGNIVQNSAIDNSTIMLNTEVTNDSILQNSEMAGDSGAFDAEIARDEALVYSDSGYIDERQKQFRVVGMVLFFISIGLCALRLCIAALSQAGVNIGYADGYLVDFVFGMLMQVGIMFLLPYLVYRFVLKKSVGKVLEFSSLRRTSGINVILSVALGFCAFFVTIGISLIWQIFLGALGFKATPDAEPNSNVGGLILTIFVVGVLPGFCEEWAFRGGFLTTLSQNYSRKATLIVCGITFGLFHQNISQLLYTALMGMLLAHLVMVCKSIIPAMIVHFMNNTIGTYLSYSGPLGWVGSGFFEFLSSHFFVTVLIFLTAVCAGIWLVGVIQKVNTTGIELPLPHLHQMTLNLATVVPVTLPSKVLTGTPDIDNIGTVKQKYTPALADYTFYIGAIAVTLLSTIFTFVWGI